MTGIAKHTVLKLLKGMGRAAAAYHNSHVRNLRVRRVEADEIWAFVYGKYENLTMEQVQAGAGSIWTWTATDADTKLIISYTPWDRGAETAQAFMQDDASRISNRIQLTTDGHRVCAESVEDAFGADIEYAMLVKIYGASSDNPESRYSPATYIGCRTGVRAGKPDPDHISTSFVERSNLSMRMGMRRFTRLTNAFSKKLKKHRHAVAMYFHALQLLPRPQDSARHPGNGSGLSGSRLEHGGTDKHTNSAGYTERRLNFLFYFAFKPDAIVVCINSGRAERTLSQKRSRPALPIR